MAWGQSGPRPIRTKLGDRLHGVEIGARHWRDSYDVWEWTRLLLSPWWQVEVRLSILAVVSVGETLERDSG